MNRLSYIVLAFLVFPITCLCQSIQGKVVRIADGDTITLLDSTNRQIRVRSYGIDCPENGQDFANVAKKLTSDLCFSKIVTVDVKDIDSKSTLHGLGYKLDNAFHIF